MPPRIFIHSRNLEYFTVVIHFYLIWFGLIQSPIFNSAINMHAVIQIIFFIDHIKNADNWVAAILDCKLANVMSFLDMVQFHWWVKPEYLEKTTSLSQVTDKLYNNMFYRPTANITDVNIQWKTPRNDEMIDTSTLIVRVG